MAVEPMGKEDLTGTRSPTVDEQAKASTQRHTRARANITKTSTGELGYDVTVEIEDDRDMPFQLSRDVKVLLQDLRNWLEAEIAREA